MFAAGFFGYESFGKVCFWLFDLSRDFLGAFKTNVSIFRVILFYALLNF